MSVEICSGAPVVEDDPWADVPPPEHEWSDYPDDSTPADAVKQAGKASVSTQLVELAEASYRFGQSSKHEPFAVPLEGSNVARMLRGAGGSLRAELAAAYFAEHRKIAPQQALTDATLTLEGMAQQADPEALHLRSAVGGESVWLDLGDTTGRAVQITGHGWRVQDSAPMLFHRTALTAALPEPETGGTLGELWAMLNVAPEDHPLVLAWLLAALFTPDLPCPVLALTGEQGTGKTTATKRAAALVDPTHPQVRRSPKDGEAWVSAGHRLSCRGPGQRERHPGMVQRRLVPGGDRGR